MTDLGTLDGRSSFAGAINASGQVVGTSFTSGTGQHAFLWEAGHMRDLGTLGGGTNSSASSINAAGLVVGSAAIDSGPGAPPHAVLWDSGHIRDLGTLGGNSSNASAVNDAGQVAGTSFVTNDAAQHAFIWGNGSMRDLGTLGGEHSGASAINIRGWVVGGSAMPGRTSFVHAFFWDGTQMADLGTLGGVLFGATLVVFALSPWFWVCVVALVGVGAGQQVYMASNNALIQTNVEEEFRGRIVSTLFLNRSMVPLGTVLAGFGTQLVGVQATTAAMAAGLLLLALTIARLAPAARNLD